MEKEFAGVFTIMALLVHWPGFSTNTYATEESYTAKSKGSSMPKH
jgi:hypothetical protein